MSLYKRSGGNIKVELDISNYATKDTLRGATGIDTLNLAAKLDLAKIDIDRLKPVPTDLIN